MSYKLTQTGQRVQELLNQIENGGQSQVTDAVLYSEQALNEKEQAQARKNIGAAAENQIPTGAVLYSQQQNLTGDQQAQARTNIGVPNKVSELENDAHYITESQVPIALPQKTGAIQSGVLPTSGWSTFDKEWVQTTLPANRRWHDVAYGDGKFVAVASDSDKGAYSTDGISWTEMSMPANRDWYSVTYGNGKFVAVALGTDKGAYSTDGINWTEFTMPASRDWRSVIYGDGTFVTVAHNSSVGAYSPDGITWTTTTLPANRYWYSVTYGNGKFVAVAENYNSSACDKGACSNDGINWVEVTLPARQRWRCVAYGSGKFVAMGLDSRYGAYSTDGINWGRMSLSASRSWLNITYGDGRFVSLASSSEKGAYSTDGINWVEFTLPSTEFWSGVTYGNDKFVAVASQTNKGASGPKVTYLITDTSITANSDILMELTDEGGVKSYSMEAGKITVIRDTVPTQPIPYTYKVKQTNASGQFTLVNHYVPQKVSEFENDAHYVTQNQVPVALPQKTGVIQSGVLPTAGWSPFDGDWQDTTMPWEQPWNDVAYGDGKFVAIAEQTSRGAYSEDGITWKQMNMPVSAYWSSIAYGNGKFVAVSYNNSTVSAYSLDGVNWTQTTMPASANWCSVIYGADKFVAVANPSDRAAYSLDGITWVETTMPSNSPWLDIAYGNNKFIVVSYEGGNLAYSNDGITWEQTTMFPYAGWRSVAYGNGVFVAVERDSNNAAYSSDGINWTMTKLPASGFWGHVVYGNGLFVATIGDGSAAAYSRDGINWTSLGKTTRDYWDVAYGDGKFVAVFYGQEGAYLKIAPGVVYTIRDNSITETSDVLMEVSDSGQIQAHGISKYNITIIRDTEPTASIPYTYKVKETNNQGQFTIVNNYLPDIPTKVSQLENDAHYITESQVPTKISQFANDMDYATVGQIPTKVSQLNNDQNFTDNIGTITQIKINGKVKNPQPSGLIDLGNITPEPTDWTTVPITTALENGKTYVVKLDTTPYPLTAIFTMSEALDAIDANVVGGTQQGTDGASTYELQSATITVKDGKLTGLKSTNLVSNANPGAANLAYSESTFADLGITQYHYIELLNSVGGGMSGKGVNYTAIKDTLAIDKWTTDEIHVEGEILPTAEIVLVTFDDTVQHTIDKTKENTLLIGHATADELKNIGYWAFDGQSLVVNVISSTDPNTNAPLQVLFSETTDTYFKYLYQESNTTLATLYVYKSNYDTYTAGDIVLVLSADTASGIDWLKCSTLMPNSELNGFPAVKLYGYELPSDLTGTSITIDVLCTKTDSPDIRKTLLLPYVGSEEVAPGAMLHMYIYEPATEEEASAFPMSFMAYVFNSNAPELAPAGTIIVFGGDQSSGSDPKYVFSKLFSLTTTGMAPVTYTYLNGNIKLESAIKVYLNDSENIQIVDRQEGYVQFKRAKVADIPFSMEILDTEEEGLLRLFNSYKEPIPTKLSQFQNDTEYLTNDDIHVTSPIMKGGSLDGKPDLWLQSSYNTSFAQYSSGVKTGTLKVDSWVEKSGYYVYTIEDYSIFNYNTDVLMTVNSPVMLEASDLTASKLELKAKSKPTEPIPYSYKLLATKEKGQFTIVNGYIPTMPVVPTKTSELENDSNFVTSADIPTKTSQLTNDSNFAVAADIPTKTSELQNDSGYVTAAEVEDVQRIEAWKHSDSDKKATLTKAGTYQTFGEFPITENDSTINYKWYGEIYFDGTSATIGTSSNYNKFNSQTSQLTMVTATPTITADENGKMLLRVEILNYRIGESPVTAATDYIAFKYRKITNEDAVERQKIYGVDLVGSENPSALVRTDDAVGLNVTVHTSEITSDFDNCYPWSAIEEVTDDAGNVFIKIPKFYSKITKNADGTCKHQLSGKKHDGFSTLFVDGAGNEIDYVLVGKYEGSGTAERVYSKSGATVLREITLDNFRAACRANGAGYQQYDFLIDLIIKELWLVEMKTTNSQSIMYGYANDNPALITTGKTDTVKTSSGSPISNTDGKHAMKYRGIENLWGNTVLWCDGISFSNNKVYVCTDPASYTAGKIDAPYVYQGDRAASYGYVKKVEPLGQNPLIQYVTEVGGSLTTYFCDAVEVNHSPSAPATALTVGGGLGITTNAGLWNWKGQYPLNANSYIGGRLCYKPSQST